MTSESQHGGPSQPGAGENTGPRFRGTGAAGGVWRVGIGHDTHRLAADRALVLGGVAIDWDRGLVGHSDADVLLHAVTDAVLGAAGLGDIGELFPDTDPAYRGADSGHLLHRVVDLIQSAGWEVVNCDCIVFAQRPKLSGYKAAIRDNVARLLRVETKQVNVKAKTGEQVGPVGREEAMEAQAVVLLGRRDG